MPHKSQTEATNRSKKESILEHFGDHISSVDNHYTLPTVAARPIAPTGTQNPNQEERTSKCSCSESFTQAAHLLDKLLGFGPECLVNHSYIANSPGLHVGAILMSCYSTPTSPGYVASTRTIEFSMIIFQISHVETLPLLWLLPMTFSCRVITLLLLAKSNFQLQTKKFFF